MPVAEKLDPVTLALMNAPVTTEPETESERRAVETARKSLRDGEGTISLEDLAKDLGVEL